MRGQQVDFGLAGGVAQGAGFAMVGYGGQGGGADDFRLSFRHLFAVDGEGAAIGTEPLDALDEFVGLVAGPGH